MQIDTGLFDHMVLQRDARDQSDQPITGKSKASGAVKARVRAGGKSVRGLDGATIGQAARGKFTARLKGIPVGGPYEIELSVGDQSVTVRNVLVGDVWIAGGQSNMQGCGERRGRCAPQKRVRAFYMDDRWDVACDPIHNMWKCVDQVHVDLCGGVKPGLDKFNGVGPAVAFGQEMHKLSGGVPQGILACAHGGTSMAQWNPKNKPGGGKSLYGATIRRLKKNGGRVAGMVWYQGESDSVGDNKPWESYTKSMKALIAALRRDTKDARLPVAVVQLSRVVGLMAWPGWNSVQEQQRRLPEVVKNVVTVPAIDLSMSDAIHIGGRDQQRLGKRLAHGMWSITHGRGKAPPAIALKDVRVEKHPVNGCARIVVKFANVVGRLTTGGTRPVGFSLRDGENGNEFAYGIELDTDSAIIHTNAILSDLATTQLAYGRGTDPTCNITDAADRAVPVFGPRSVVAPRAISPCVRKFEVSAIQPDAGKLNRLSYPSNLKALKLKPRTFVGDFSEAHGDLAKFPQQDRVLYYRCVVNVTEPMKLSALIGYDGPVKMWVDRKLRFFDPKGTNPAMKDKKSVAIPGTPGKHEIVIALGSNKGLAWGIFLRFERHDIPRNLRESSPAQYAMPSLV